jgi:hypothetical protein
VRIRGTGTTTGAVPNPRIERDGVLATGTPADATELVAIKIGS